MSSFEVYCHSGVCSHKCLVKQEPCLYALPQCSHLSSPEAALSFFDRCVPSLARRIFNFLSSAWKEEREGPSTTALLLKAEAVEWEWAWGREGRLPTVDWLAMSCSEARADLEKVELFRRPMRLGGLLLVECECVRLKELRVGTLKALGPLTDSRCWLIGREVEDVDMIVGWLDWLHCTALHCPKMRCVSLGRSSLLGFASSMGAREPDFQNRSELLIFVRLESRLLSLLLPFGDRHFEKPIGSCGGR